MFTNFSDLEKTLPLVYRLPFRAYIATRSREQKIDLLRTINEVASRVSEGDMTVIDEIAVKYSIPHEYVLNIKAYINNVQNQNQ